MNPNDRFDDFQADEREELTHLVETADRLQPSEQFIKRTEMQLKDAFSAKKEKTMKRYNLLWQILAGTAAVAALTLGTIWLVRHVAPEPRNPAVSGEASPTPLSESTPLPEATLAPTVTPETPSYTWNGTTVYRAAGFPQAPAEMNIYTHSADIPATIETARKLAERFGIQGEIYLAPDSVAGSNSFLITDGMQRLYVNSERHFSYQARSDVSFQGAPVALDIASGSIDAFLKAHGFDFAYRLEANSPAGGGDWFLVIPLTPDDGPARFDISQADGSIQVQVDPQGQVVSLNASIPDVNPQPVGKYGVISAEEAWQKVLQDTPLGVSAVTSSNPGAGALFWQRTYPNDQPVTLVGRVSHFAPVEAGKPPFISIDVYTAIGETAGLENLRSNVFVEAKGQFIDENGIQKFKIASWQVSKTGSQYLIGNLRSEGGKVVFSSQATDYTLSDVPTEVPIPVENIDVTGIVNGSQLDWQSIFYHKDGIRGGGGGGGGEFAKLNLSGTPVPWPTLAPVATPESLVGQRVDGQRGIVTANIFQKADGSQRTVYNFSTADNYYTLQGQELEKLKTYNNRPVVIWGTVAENSSPYQAIVLNVERYEAPFPDLEFQILRGKQKRISLEGQQVILFTTEAGESYVQLIPTSYPLIPMPADGLIGVEGDLVQEEVLVVPDETFGGYPTIRFFGGNLANNPKTGQPEIPEITADKPHVMPEMPQTSETPPTLTIESIEMIYYTTNPEDLSSAAMTSYLQPAWRFYGHYSDGSRMEILVQALKEEFLLPEAAPAVQGG